MKDRVFSSKKYFIHTGIIIMIFMVLFSLSSCLSFNEVKEDSSFPEGIDNIKENLDKNMIDVFEAYILAAKNLKKKDIDDKELQKTKDFLFYINRYMNENLTKEYSKGKYDEALKYALSLRTINADSTLDIGTIYRKMSAQLDLTGDPFTRYDVKEEMADLKLLSEDEVSSLLKYYFQNKMRGVFLYYYNRYTVLYPELLSKFPDLKKNRDEMDNFGDLNFEKLMRSVVTVILNKGMNIKDGMGYFDKSIGTGFFIDDKGYILTNHHVIADHVDPNYKGYSMVYVTTRDEPDVEIPAKVIGFDKVFDIALLKTVKKNSDHLILGRSDDVAVGDKIYTIGNPIGIKYTVTSGIVSNKEIEFFQLGKAFQVDAAINPGNSGGPLIDDKGQVVGIVFAGIPQFAGINFAIPFEWVRKTIPSLYKGGETKRCWMGAGIYQENKKVFFYYVLPGGPASRAGIQIGDRLDMIDGFKVESVEQAQSLLAWKRYPMLLNVRTQRNNDLTGDVVRLEERPYIPLEEIFEKDIEKNIITLVFGIGVEYYGNSFFYKKYKTTKIYNGMYGNQLNVGEGDPIVVYELKYLQKDKLVRLTLRYKQKELGIIERIVTVISPAEINSLI
jgi:S1-C subfamily serine protease